MVLYFVGMSFNVFELVDEGGPFRARPPLHASGY